MTAHSSRQIESQGWWGRMVLSHSHYYTLNLIWFETVYLYSVNTLHRIAQIMCIQVLWSVWLQCMLGRYVIVADCMQLIIAPQWVTKPLFSDLGLVLHGHCSGFLYMFRTPHWWSGQKCTQTYLTGVGFEPPTLACLVVWGQRCYPLSHADHLK